MPGLRGLFFRRRWDVAAAFWYRRITMRGATSAAADVLQVRHEVEALSGLHVLRDEFLGVEASHDLDPLHLVIDVSGLDINGYAAADWLREHQRLDMAAGMQLPDPADPSLHTIRVVAR